jgi:hypothetical protein
VRLRALNRGVHDCVAVNDPQFKLHAHRRATARASAPRIEVQPQTNEQRPVVIEP